MALKKRKEKMVSFRVSTEEYRRLREACSKSGLSSISELARVAAQRFIGSVTDTIPVEEHLLSICERVLALKCELNSLALRAAADQGPDRDRASR